MSQAPQGDAMILFMRQDDIIGVAQLIGSVRKKSVYISWPSPGGPSF